jgi:hypothetical protein
MTCVHEGQKRREINQPTHALLRCAKHPTAAIREPFALSSRTRLALGLSWQRERHLPTEVVGVLNSHAKRGEISQHRIVWKLTTIHFGAFGIAQAMRAMLATFYLCTP